MADRPEETEDRSELRPEDSLDGVREHVLEKQGLKGLEEVSESEPKAHGTEKGENEGAPEEGANEQEDEAGSTNEGSSAHDNSTDHAYESGKTAATSFDEQAPAEDGKEVTLNPQPEEGVEAKNSSGAGEEYLRDVTAESSRTDEKPQEIDSIEPKAAPAEVESHSRNDNQVVVTGYKGSERPGGETVEPVQTSDFQRFQPDATAEQEEETRTFEAVDYGKGVNVRLPKSDLEEAGYDASDHNAVVKVDLRKVEEDDVDTVFARYNTSDRRAEAYVANFGGEKGSKYELIEAAEVDEDKLVMEFERSKCDHLQNVKLERTDDRMFLSVDDREVELEDYRLSTSGSHAVLSGKLDGKDSCKFEFDGRRASVKFGRDYHVEEMRMEGDDMVVRYAQSRNERHEHRIPLEHRESRERPTLDQFDKEEMKERVNMFDCPERTEGVYQFVLDRASSTEVQRLLTEARERGNNDYGMMKAEISERLVPNMLEIAGWERVKWHPFNHTEKEGADAPGSDWLLRTPDGKEVLVEIKWYGNTRDAIRKATTQVEKDFRQHRDDPDSELEGAYVAILDYDEDSNVGRPIKVHVLNVHSQEILK